MGLMRLNPCACCSLVEARFEGIPSWNGGAEFCVLTGRSRPEAADHSGILPRPQTDPCASPILGLSCDLMRVIALQTIKHFIESKPEYGDSREPALAWYRQVLRADWASPADVKREIGTASILKDGRAVFNIAGNKYRIVVWINYPYRVVYVRFIGTHAQYDRIDAQAV